MHKGFYVGKDDGDGCYENMENITVSDEYRAYDFLHGFCTCFAKIINVKFGYPVECIWDECGCLIHAYCVTDIDDKRYFIDARGVTDDVYEFLDEFGDWLPTYSYPCENTTVSEKFSFPVGEEYLECAEKLFNDYYEYYTL